MQLALLERYTLAIIGVSFACASLFPFVGLYAPQRGVTLFEEVPPVGQRLAAARDGMVRVSLFLSKSGSDFCASGRSNWIVGGFLVDLIVRGGIRITLRTLRRRGTMSGGSRL